MDTTSILNLMKKSVGVSEEYTHYDPDIIMHTNTILSVLTELGVGPATGFRIEDAKAIWTDFLGDDCRLEMVKSYMAIRIRILFDPPTNTALLTALKEQASEFEWRINDAAETSVVPTPTPT